jgi:hypothetical protein
MTISSKPAQLVVSIKQHSMHIGKSTRMAGTDESSFEYEVFHKPANPRLWMIKNKLKCRKAVGWTCMQEK